MITKLSIANFKSIRQLDIDCKKVNVFIGEPNTGKSNILEALALLSWCGRHSQQLRDYVRLQLLQNLFMTVCWTRTSRYPCHYPPANPSWNYTSVSRAIALNSEINRIPTDSET